MSRKLFYMVCFILLFGATVKTFAADPNTIPKAGLTPVIDGQMDDIWSSVTEFKIAVAVTAASSEADCSGSWRAYWDDQYFYVFFNVKDDTLSGDATTVGDKYNDDSVEIFFDIGNTKTTTYGANHYQYRFGYDPANSASGTIGADHTTNTITGIIAAWKFTSTGYTVEARVPWSTLSATPAINQVMGFEAQINDDDNGTARDSQLAWHATANQAYQNPTYFGTVTLVAPLKPINVATKPYPLDKSEDIETNVQAYWTPGNYILKNGGSHNVFIGPDFNDVNNSTVSALAGETLFQTNVADNNDFDPSALITLEFGKTYYWRVDEVNAPPKNGQYKGQVWSFTTEREALDLPFANIEKVTAISSGTSQDANNTVNGYGLGVDANFPDQHTNAIGSWASTGTDAPNNVWIQYDFDKQYKIHQMMVWNYNQNLLSAKGFKDVLVQYSEDGDTWIDMPGITKFEKAPGKPYYDVHDSNNIFDFNDVIVKSVRITALSNYGNKAYGLSEVRFTYIPVRARIPSPADGTQNVAFGTIFKWRKGREALTHKFYIGTDKDAVINGTVTPITVNVSSYSPNLSLESTYYWRVDEINTSLNPSVWKGNIWTFTTPSTILIDGFEKGYGNDTNTDAVFLTWQDAGILSTAGGSWMGRKSEPFLDVINHTGGHSAPMEYNNQSYSYSEVTADTSKLQNGSNWSLGNPGALVIWFMSDANDVNEPALDRLYVRIGSTKKVYPGPASDIRRTSWTKWEIPLAGISLGNVSTLTIGVERIGSTGSIGVIYLDDIMLTPASPAAAAKVNPGTNGLLAKYTMDDNVQDSSGHGLNGTLTGTANGGLSYVDSMSGFGKALVFDGNDDCVDLGKMEAFNFAGSFSVTLWAKASTWSTNWGNVMISNRGEATGGGWQIRRYTNNTVCFTTRGVSNDDTNSNFNVAIREWNNITCVYDSEAHTKSIYINGVLDRKVNLTGTVTKVTATTTKTFIGGRSNSGNTGLDAGTFFKGMLDQVIIYDRALSAGEAAYLAAPTP